LLNSNEIAILHTSGFDICAANIPASDTGHFDTKRKRGASAPLCSIVYEIA